MIKSLIVVVLLVPSWAWADVAHVQTVKAVDNDGNTTATSAAATFSGGSLAICTVLLYEADPAPTVTATLDGGTSFTLDRTQTFGVMRVTVLSLPNISSGSHTCNVIFSATTSYATIFLTEVSGALGTAAIDGAGAGANGSSAAAASGAYTTVTTSFVIAAVVSASSANPTTMTAGSGWTIPTNGSETDGSINLTGAVEYKANPGTTSHNGEFTVTNTDWVAAGVAYLVAGAGGGGGGVRTLTTTGAGR